MNAQTAFVAGGLKALRLLELPREAKRWIAMAVDAPLLVLSLYLAAILRLGSLAPLRSPDIAVACLLIVPVSLFLFLRLGFYRTIVRYISLAGMYGLLLGVAIAALLLAAVIVLTPLQIPRSVPVLFALLAWFGIGGSRIVGRELLVNLQNGHRRRHPVAIYGAGSAGRQLANSLLHSAEFAPVLLLDDDPALNNRTVLGITVASPGRLGALIPRYRISRIVLAMPSASRARRKQILDRLEHFPVPVLTVPSIDDLLSGRQEISMLTEVQIEDLLGRDPVPPQTELLEANIRGQVVMVTGAGGSIGSQLCRQAIRHGPRQLILFEISEFALYSIEAELDQLKAAIGAELEITAMLGSVRDRDRLEAVMKRFAVNTVYHAAAYKHVPIVERNICEGVMNNTIGTWVAAQAAIGAGVDNFVLISTDKAVRPTNAMGSSKRIAEMVCQALAASRHQTRFCIVRFGNVLGSSGSVVPLFREQICKGGPVTVTHPDVTRFFMTIPEAAQLVIQAGAMGQGGDIFVLDMGSTVRIDDLARKMIRLSGLQVRDADNPDGDIEITYVGLRAGEKLCEELLIGGDVSGTSHPKIMRYNEDYLPLEALQPALQELTAACRSSNPGRVRELLLGLPIAYTADAQEWDHLGLPASTGHVTLH